MNEGDVMTRCAIVVPCFNEEEVFDDSNTKLLKVLDDLISKNKIDNESFILYVDDGSKDKTWEKITEASRTALLPYMIPLAWYAIISEAEPYMKRDFPSMTAITSLPASKPAL